MQRKKTVIYIDESGIHKQTDHSTFALVYITFSNLPEVEKRIIAIEKNLRIDSFHWARHSWTIKKAFINKINNLPFEAKVAVFRNPTNPSEALEWAIMHTVVEKEFGTIYLDGKKPRWVLRQIKKTLRYKGFHAKNVKSVNDKSYPAMRVADAIAGLVRAHYDEPLGKSRPLWVIVRKKITAQMLGGQADG